MSTLDKEKNIEELEKKIASLALFSKEQGLDLSREVLRLRKKLAALRVQNFKSLEAWDRVTLARLRGRPTTLEYIEYIFDDFIELHGDRAFGDDSSIVGGIAFLEGRAVTVIGQQKGRDTQESIARNFGMTLPEGYRKALRLMKQAEKFNRPVILFVDTPGAFCGLGAEERGQGEAIARNLMEMSRLRIPIISTVIGEGGSGGALGLAVADQVFMLENAIYSILSPEGFASILWKDAGLARKAAQVMKITAEDLLELGIIDGIIEEPLGGAQKDKKMVFEKVEKQIKETLTQLDKLDKNELIEGRYQRFRVFGSFQEDIQNEEC
ncbi:acetyl-CoA carboxylase carboxyltransferase subunit alpha [Clostridia bacterium]|nr:acetyl-CoA carboxylase carboxyltransferase subunit alpha [Clostridia bacterium]